MDPQNILDWFYDNHKPGKPWVELTPLRLAYEEETQDYMWNQINFPRALRNAGLVVERGNCNRMVIKGWTRKAGA